MDFKKLVKESLSMMEKSDQGIIFQDIDNQVVHVADAAFYKKEVFPKDLLRLLEGNFAMSGFPLDDAQFRKDLVDFLRNYELAKQMSKKRTPRLEPDFGKIM